MLASLATWRLGPQRLVGEPLPDVGAVVAHLGAVQAQEHGWAPWALGRRCGATLAEVEDAYAAGLFVRTHVLRPTWHYVLAADLADLLDVTGPRVRRLMVSHNRGLGLDQATLEAAADAAVEAIVAEGPLTRAEVGERLADAGLPSAGTELANVMMEAEVSGRVASGPMRGRRHTYRALDLVPSGRSREEQLAWIATTYVRGHGPSTAADLAWWTSLTLTQAREALALAELPTVRVDDRELVTHPGAERVDVPRALLVANFDELISYARDRHDRDGLDEQEYEAAMRSGGLLFVDGGLAGSWTRTARSGSVEVEVRPARPLDRPTRAAVADEAAAFGRFLGLEPDLRVVAPTA